MYIFGFTVGKIKSESRHKLILGVIVILVLECATSSHNGPSMYGNFIIVLCTSLVKIVHFISVRDYFD